MAEKSQMNKLGVHISRRFCLVLIDIWPFPARSVADRPLVYEARSGVLQNIVVLINTANAWDVPVCLINTGRPLARGAISQALSQSRRIEQAQISQYDVLVFAGFATDACVARKGYLKFTSHEKYLVRDCGIVQDYDDSSNYGQDLWPEWLRLRKARELKRPSPWSSAQDIIDETTRFCDQFASRYAVPIDLSEFEGLIRREQKSKVKLLSVVMTGRNDDYAGDFAERTLAAQMRNQREAAKVGVTVDWIFVEWNPTNEDYLSYRLASQLHFRCFVVDPKWHEKLIAPEMTFSQSFAKNVGIRRALGEWILVTNADVVFDDCVWLNIATGLSPGLLYRAERCDIDWHLFGRPFEILQNNIVCRHLSGGSKGFTVAAGDFLLFPAQRRFGFDEAINYSDIYTDGRFCENWSALMSNGLPNNFEMFQFIGDVFKAEHPLTYMRTWNDGKPNPKGRMNWNYHVKTHEGLALYENKPDWGLRDAKMRELRDGVFYLEY